MAGDDHLGYIPKLDIDRAMLLMIRSGTGAFIHRFNEVTEWDADKKTTVTLTPIIEMQR